MKKSAFIFCSVLFFGGPLLSQLPDYHVQKLSANNALIQPSQADEMMRDDKGFFWLLTPTKVQRFDGKNILSFSFEDQCIGIQQDDEGTVWVLTRQNIYEYKNGFYGFEKLPAYSSTVNKYLRLLAGPQKKLYLLSTEAILRWNSATRKMDQINTAPFKSGGNFPFLEFYGHCLFYRSSGTTIIRYNILTGAQDSLHVQQPSYLIPLDADNIWVRQGIGSTIHASFKTKEIAPLGNAQFDDPVTGNNFFITAAFENRPGEFFTMVKNQGYYVYNIAANRFKKIIFFYNGRLLTGKPLLTRNNFFKEKNGTAWFNNEEGFFYVNPVAGNIGLLRSGGSSTGSQWDNDIRNLTEDDKGNIWFSTANGFCKWDKPTGTVSTWLPNYTATDHLNYPSVKSIGYSKGKIIIGQSEKGFWIFDPVKQTFSRPKFKVDSLKKKFENEFNRNMLRLSNGNFLIISNTLWLMDKETFYVRQVKVPELTAAARKGFEDAQGRIWILGRAGIMALDKDFNVLYNLPDEALGKWYNTIVQIDENTFWVASKSLYELKIQPEKKLAIKPIFPELKNQHFSNLFKDSLGHIWMCHDEGMYRYIPEKNITEKLDRSDNIQDFYISVSNDLRGSDGMVYFGSLGGINYFVPEKIPPPNDSLQIQLLNVTVNQDDSSFLLSRSLQRLRYHQNMIVFDFVSPWLYNAEKIQYRYKLVGADKDWMHLGNTSSVRFNSLQPGNYTFHAAASLNGKDWYAMPSPFSFFIKPPFWQTLWFIMLVLLTVTALAIFLIRRRIRFIKKREAEKTELQKIKAASYQARLEAEQVINYFATSIFAHTTVEEMLWGVAKNLIGKLGFEDCMIYLWNKDKTVLIQQAGFGLKGSMQSAFDKNIYHVPKGKGIVGAAVETCQPIIANDTSLDSRYFTADGKIRLSELCVPIIHNNEVMGAINTEHSEKNFYTDRHLHILSTIASMLADKMDMIEAQEQAREKEMEVLKLSKDLATSQLTALRAQMNPHFIFNAMNSIQQFTLKNDVDNANLYISKFSTLLRKVLHSSQQSYVTLEQEIEQLNLYLDIEKLRLGNEFSYYVKAGDEIETDALKIPGMMVQPFVENALKHGLSPKEGKKNLSVEFLLAADNKLEVTVTDNGIGRKKAEELKQQQQKLLPYESKGIQLVKERLQLLNKSVKVDFLSIEDLADLDKNPAGTKVTLLVPLSMQVP